MKDPVDWFSNRSFFINSPQQGSWLGSCMKSSAQVRCPAGTYSDQQQCKPCPCPSEGRRYTHKLISMHLTIKYINMHARFSSNYFQIWNFMLQRHR